MLNVKLIVVMVAMASMGKHISDKVLKKKVLLFYTKHQWRSVGKFWAGQKIKSHKIYSVKTSRAKKRGWAEALNKYT